MASAQRTSTFQAITTGAWAFGSFTAELFDTNTMFAPTDTKITIKKAGVYCITAWAEFASNATGLRLTMIEKNAVSAGTAPLLRTVVNGSTSTDVVELNSTTLVQLAATDTIHLSLFQSSGGNLNTLSRLSVAFIGATT